MWNLWPGWITFLLKRCFDILFYVLQFIVPAVEGTRMMGPYLLKTWKNVEMFGESCGANI